MEELMTKQLRDCEQMIRKISFNCSSLLRQFELDRIADELECIVREELRRPKVH